MRKNKLNFGENEAENRTNFDVFKTLQNPTTFKFEFKVRHIPENL